MEIRKQVTKVVSEVAAYECDQCHKQSSTENDFVNIETNIDAFGESDVDYFHVCSVGCLSALLEEQKERFEKGKKHGVRDYYEVKITLKFDQIRIVGDALSGAKNVSFEE